MGAVSHGVNESQGFSQEYFSKSLPFQSFPLGSRAELITIAASTWDRVASTFLRSNCRVIELW